MDKNHGNALHVTTIGYERVPGIPIEDYEDFVSLKQSVAEVECTLRYGHFPPGLILHDTLSGTTARVVGDYGSNQKLRRMK